jgi:hypothetical protein
LQVRLAYYRQARLVHPDLFARATKAEPSQEVGTVAAAAEATAADAADASVAAAAAAKQFQTYAAAFVWLTATPRLAVGLAATSGASSAAAPFAAAPSAAATAAAARRRLALEGSPPADACCGAFASASEVAPFRMASRGDDWLARRRKGPSVNEATDAAETAFTEAKEADKTASNPTAALAVRRACHLKS